MPIKLLFSRNDDVRPEMFVSKTDGVITVDLGDNSRTGLSYSLWCSLHPRTAVPGAMEFAFWIADYDPETRHMDKIWHGSDTTHLIVGQDRALVLALVKAALSELVRRLEPNNVFIQTMAPHLPDKALLKYYQLGETLTELGYDFRRLPPYHGYEAWVAKHAGQ
jgi:hypothetical protein